MITVVIGIIAALFGLMVCISKFVVGLFLIVIGLGAILCAVIIGDATFIKNSVATKKVNNIVALKNYTLKDKKCFLETEWDNGVQYYYCVVEEERGMKVIRIQANDLYIKYTDDAPRIEILTKKLTDNANWFLLHPKEEEIIIYIPEECKIAEIKKSQ